MLTFLTPVSPDHQQYLPACIATVQEQTISCQHLIMHDAERRGPGIIRNRLLAEAETEYVSFLDADDWLERDFAKKMLAAVQHATYAYSDWYQDGQFVQAPERAWCNGTFHLVTAVVPRMLAVQVGGFDEALPALEDTDFFLKFISREWCGIRVPYPLVHYRAHGGRSDAIHKQEIELVRTRAELARRYGGKPVGCCGGSSEVDTRPVGEMQAGDVLAMALWGGNRSEHGRATGRRYPRISYPHTTWVDPRDVRAAPHLWKTVQQEVAPAVAAQFELSTPPAPKGVDAIRQGLAGWGTVEDAQLTLAPLPVAPIPNVNKIKRLAGAVDLPVFVAPRSIYPSYLDFWKLVDLAGFEMVYQDEVDLIDGDRTFIFSGPEGIPDCSGAKARTIFWQLEYVGDYINQANVGTAREVWSSDPAHAKATGVKFVLLGSHRALNPTQDRVNLAQYAVAMLAYMTPRRQAVKDKLPDLDWAPDYPGHDTAFRHEVLRSTRLMLHAHQHDTPAMTPLRYALAAAYRLPIISEHVLDSKPYKKTITWVAYSNLAKRAMAALSDDITVLAAKGDDLYTLLCEQHPFFDCVMEALA